jgi:hypothetical protein
MFSGFVKGIDPLGSTYKFTDYFIAFGTDWASNFSFFLAILLSVTEFAIGTALLLKYRMKLSSMLALLFMAFFLPLTLYIAIKNPVTDCGCFGDAIILDNWDTFYKNIVLALFAVIVYIERKKFVNRYIIVFQNLYFLFIILTFLAIQNHSYNHLPVFDFRPFKLGNNITELMEIPDDAAVDVYKTEFIYKNKKTGEEKLFNELNYPWQDTINWEFVDATSMLVKKGYEPPVNNFSIENSYGEDVKDFYLYDPGYTFVMISYNLNKANYRNRFNKIADDAQKTGMNFIGLTASTPREIEDFIEKEKPPFDFYFCDDITLKTIVRANPGLILLREGTIMGKWHRNDIPKFEDIDFEKLDKKFEQYNK